MVRIDGRKLRAWRERRLYTLRELEERSGVAFATIQKIETGKHEPRISTLRKLTEALGIAPEDVLAVDVLDDTEPDTGKAAA